MRFHWWLNLLISPGLIDGGTSVSDIKLPCRTHPHWLEPTIYQSETSSEKLSTPSEGIGLEARSMVSVAVKISSQNAERNIKVRYSKQLEDCVCISQICCEPLQTQVSHSVHKVLMFELFLKAGGLYSALILSMSFGSTSQSKLRNRHVSLLVVITFLNPYCGREIMLFCYVLLIK